MKLAAILLLLLPASALAQIADPTPTYRFVDQFWTAWQWAYVDSSPVEYKDSPHMEAMYWAKRRINAYDRAKVGLDAIAIPETADSSDARRMAVDGLALLLSIWKGIEEDRLDLVRNMVDGKLTTSEMMDKTTELHASYRSTLEFTALVIGALTHVMVAPEGGRLTITTAERDDLKERLVTLVGMEQLSKPDFSSDQVLLAGEVLFRFLSEGWEYSDR